jgi:hypothetical protein
MKTILALALSLSAASSFAAELYSRCEYMYKVSENSSVNAVKVHDAGKLSVKGCMNAAMKGKQEAITSVPFTYSVFTKITQNEDGSVNLDIGSEGWSLSGEIKEDGVFPKSLKFEEFVNH